MPDIRVPRRFRAPLASLARLDKDRRQRLIRAYADAPAFADHVQLFDLTQEATGAETDVAIGMVSAVLSFTIQLSSWDAPPDRLAVDAARSADLDLNDEEREQLADLLRELLASRALTTAAKGSDLVTEHEHVVSGIRILTDIRPVFGDDPAGEPEGVTISSTLKLSHYTDGREQSIYLVFDELDLRELKSQVDRALDKVESVRRLMARQDIPVYAMADPDRQSEGGSYGSPQTS